MFVISNGVFVISNGVRYLILRFLTPLRFACLPALLRRSFAKASRQVRNDKAFNHNSSSLLLTTMSDNFFSYLQRLESMAFFSGFPLIYALVFVFAGNKENRKGIKERIVSSLPFAYALVGTLYLGLQLKNLYPDYSIENIRMSIQNPWLTAWALLSILFWIPALTKKPVLALVHSLVFFYFLLRDLFSHAFGKTDKSILKNDMNIYTNSLLINITCLLIILGLSYLLLRKRRPHS